MNDINYKFQPCLAGPITACRIETVQGNAKIEADHRQGRLLGRVCGFSDCLAEAYPFVNSTDIIYLDEFLEFVNRPIEKTVERNNPYRYFRRRLDHMRNLAKQGLLYLCRRLLFPGITIRVNPLPETRVGEEEVLIVDGDMSLVRDENDEIAAKHLKIDRKRFIDLKRYDVCKLIDLMYYGSVTHVMSSFDILQKCELMNESKIYYSIEGCVISIIIFISPVDKKYHWFYIMHEGTLHDDLIRKINDQVTKYENFVPMISMELGRTNPTDNSVPYHFLDNDVYVESFVVNLGSRENWKIYLPVPYTKTDNYDHEKITRSADEWCKYFIFKMTEMESEHEPEFDNSISRSPSTLLEYRQRQSLEELLINDNKTDALTDEMRLFAIYWYNKTIEKIDSSENFHLNQFISGLLDASNVVLFSEWPHHINEQEPI